MEIQGFSSTVTMLASQARGQEEGSGVGGGSKTCSDVTHVQVCLFYPPVRRHVLRLVALHVLLHGGQARAEVLADGALIRGRAVVSAQVLDHGRVVSGPLVTQLTLEWLLTCEVQPCSFTLGTSEPRGGGALEPLRLRRLSPVCTR